MLKIFKKNKFLTDIGVYMISTSVNQAIPFLLLPVLTIYLIPGDFGYINNFSAILIIFTSIIGGGLSTNIEKHYFKEDEFFMSKLMGNLYFLLLCGTIMLFIISGFLSFIFDIQFVPENIFILIPFISFFFVSFELLKTLLKTKKQVLSFTLVTLSEVLINVSISLILVIGLLLQWRGRVYAMALSYALFGLLSLGYLIHKKYITFSIKKDILRKILRLTLPLLPSGISVMIMRKSGILFIDAFQGKTEAGLYGVGLNLATIILFMSIPFIYTWIPHVYEKLSNSNGKNIIISLRNKLFIFKGFIFSICVLVSILSGFIIRIMTTNAFLKAAIFIPWLVFGFAFWAMTTMYMPFFIQYNKQKYVAVIAIIGAGLNLILNYFAIIEVGTIGVAIAFFVSNFIVYLMIFFSVRTFCNLRIIPDFKGIYLMIKNVVK